MSCRAPELSPVHHDLAAQSSAHDVEGAREIAVLHVMSNDGTNVQSALQEQGYYQGEIDGILGPQTRAALAEFQSAQGLEPTGTVDEPTLETLGMV